MSVERLPIRTPRARLTFTRRSRLILKALPVSHALLSCLFFFFFTPAHTRLFITTGQDNFLRKWDEIIKERRIQRKRLEEIQEEMNGATFSSKTARAIW